MTPNEQSALYDIKRTLERIKEYCENRSLCCDENLERWRHLASEARYGLIKVRNVEKEAQSEGRD